LGFFLPAANSIDTVVSTATIVNIIDGLSHKVRIHAFNLSKSRCLHARFLVYFVHARVFIVGW
jgi:hypothetical protein